MSRSMSERFSKAMKMVKPQTYQCDRCHAKSDSLAQLQNHLEVKHGIVMKRCNICNKIFTNDASYNSHMQIHMNPQQMHMSAHQMRMSSLQMHASSPQMQVSSVPDFTCMYCEKKFKCKSTLKKHMNSHLNVCDFSCNMCEKAFRTKDTLKRHMAAVHQVHLQTAKQKQQSIR